jgi:hypothetical protein
MMTLTVKLGRAKCLRCPNSVADGLRGILQITGAALARHTGEEESEKIRHLYQRLAILLVKGNAALFLNRLPSHPSPMIDGSE